MRALPLVLLCLLLPAAPVLAEGREAIGNGRIFNNDIFGDGHDRWRTGSYAFSHLRAPHDWRGEPQDFGDVLEYRLRAEIIAPRRGSRDRPYVGALSAGLHTHWGDGALSYALGADVVAIGPQTRLADFQRAYHRTFSLPRPPVTDPLGDDVALSATASATYRLELEDGVTLRPFVEAQTGVEDVLRVGGDVLIGPVGQTDLMLRDVVTGQLYRGTQGGGSGVSYLLGADVAQVGDSLYLPPGEGPAPLDTRTRARAGVHWQPVPDITFFYGVTWLSEEYEGQPEGQVTGSLRLNFNF